MLDGLDVAVDIAVITSRSVDRDDLHHRGQMPLIDIQVADELVPIQKTGLPRAIRTLINSVLNYWCEQYPKIRITKLYAYAESDERWSLIRHLFFTPRYDIGERAFELDPRWLKDIENYRRSLPIEVQQVLEEHESNSTTDSEQYQEAAMEFYQRYLCRLHPWPEPLERTLAGEGTIVYNTMWGPAEFYMTGNLLNYDCTTRLAELAIPSLFTCGQYDEATPETTAWYQSLL